jgi:hypothetical protein
MAHSLLAASVLKLDLAYLFPTAFWVSHALLTLLFALTWRRHSRRRTNKTKTAVDNDGALGGAADCAVEAVASGVSEAEAKACTFYLSYLAAGPWFLCELLTDQPAGLFCAWGLVTTDSVGSWRIVFMSDTYWFCFRRIMFCFVPWLLVRLFARRSRCRQLYARLLQVLLCLWQLSMCREILSAYGYWSMIASPGLAWPLIAMATNMA